VGAEGFFPVVVFGFFFQLLEVEEAVGIEGDDAFTGVIVADEEFEGIVAKDSGVAVGEVDRGGEAVILLREAWEPELGGGEFRNDDVRDLEAFLGRGEGGVFIDLET